MVRERLRWLWLLTVVGVSLPLGSQGQVAVPVQEVRAGDVRVDGSLGEWKHVRFSELRDDLGDIGLRYAFGYDAQGLYIAGDVSDEDFFRTPASGTDEDAVVVTLARPEARGAWHGHDVWLLAGVPGKQASVVRVGRLGGRTQPLKSAKIVEGPRPQGAGYVFEAFVPWQTIGGPRGWERARVAIRLRDVDRSGSGRPPRELSSAVVRPDRLDALPPLDPSGGSGAALRALLDGLGLQGQQPRHDFAGDVTGDGRDERVVIVGTYVAVMGPSHGDGQGFEYLSLPVAMEADVKQAELLDITGDGKAELVCVLRQRNARGERDLWQAISFTDGSPRRLFAIETRKVVAKGSVASRIRVQRKGRARQIVVTAGTAKGLHAPDLQDDHPRGPERILLPWGPIRERVYQWQGERFAVVREKPNASYPPPLAASSPSPAASSSVGSEAGATAIATPTHHGREAPGEPEAADTTQRLIAAFRIQRAIAPEVRPRFVQHANLVGDAQPEQVSVWGTSLLVLGPGYKQGQSYLFIDLPAQRDADVLELTTADLTGDGHAEVIVRLRDALRGDAGASVERETLLVKQLHHGGMRTLLRAEVTLRMAQHEIRNRVRIVGQGRKRQLLIEPGTTRGWDAASYPFQSTQHGIEPLLLPWRDHPVRYRLVGEVLVGAKP